MQKPVSDLILDSMVKQIEGDSDFDDISLDLKNIFLNKRLTKHEFETLLRKEKNNETS